MPRHGRRINAPDTGSGPTDNASYFVRMDDLYEASTINILGFFGEHGLLRCSPHGRLAVQRATLPIQSGRAVRLSFRGKATRLVPEQGNATTSAP